MAALSAAPTSVADQQGLPQSGSDTTVTLGIAHDLMRRTLVTGLSGSILKQSPSDFVVVEMPLSGGEMFTPANASEPLPEHVKKPSVVEVKHATLSLCNIACMQLTDKVQKRVQSTK